MTHNKVIGILLKKKSISKLYHRLILWDESKTFQENAFALRVPTKSYSMLRMFAYGYSLKFKVSEFASRNFYKRKPKKDYTHLWDETKTIQENAKNLKISIMYARHVASQYNLKFAYAYKSGLRIIKEPRNQMGEVRKQMMALYSIGMTMANIGKAFGVTRERVRQIVNP